MISRFRTVIFDLDGTLVNTIGDISRAFNTVLSAHGNKTYEATAYLKMVGWGLAHTLEMATNGDIEETVTKNMLREVIEEYQLAPTERSYIYNGISSLVSWLREDDVRLIVYTNKEEKLASAIVGALFPAEPFDEVIGGSREFPSKPETAALFARIGEENRNNSSILFIGDSDIDRKTAENAGFSFAGAGWGFGGLAAFRQDSETLVFDDPTSIDRWIQNKGTGI